MQYIGYEKEIKKEYLETEDPKPLYARSFSVIDFHDNNSIIGLSKSNLNSMSFWILSYNGPSSLTPEDELYNMPKMSMPFVNIIAPELSQNEEAVQYRNNEYLVRARQKVASMFDIDSHRFPHEPPAKGNAKDVYLVEMKGFDKQNSNNQNSGGKRLPQLSIWFYW